MCNQLSTLIDTSSGHITHSTSTGCHGAGTSVDLADSVWFGGQPAHKPAFQFIQISLKRLHLPDAKAMSGLLSWRRMNEPTIRSWWAAGFTSFSVHRQMFAAKVCGKRLAVDGRALVKGLRKVDLLDVLGSATQTSRQVHTNIYSFHHFFFERKKLYKETFKNK